VKPCSLNDKALIFAAKAKDSTKHWALNWDLYWQKPGEIGFWKKGFYLRVLFPL
jgi:hypothetical protein